MSETTYPPSVIQASQNIISMLGDDFFIENEINDIESGKEISNKILCEYLLSRFINGNDLIFESEEKCEEILKNIVVQCYINSLVKKGLIDIYEDENTPPTVFLTQKGKNHVNPESTRS